MTWVSRARKTGKQESLRKRKRKKGKRKWRNGRRGRITLKTYHYPTFLLWNGRDAFMNTLLGPRCLKSVTCVYTFFHFNPFLLDLTLHGLPRFKLLTFCGLCSWILLWLYNIFLVLSLRLGSQVQTPHVPRFTKTFSIRKGVALCSRRSFARIFLRSILHHTFIPSQPQIVVCRTLLCAPRNNAAFFQPSLETFHHSNFYSFFLLSFKILSDRKESITILRISHRIDLI